MMTYVFQAILIVFFTICTHVSALSADIFNEDFTGNEIDLKKWHVPYWGDQFLGRTCFESISFPKAENGCAKITVESYNPEDSSCFLGTDLISNNLIPLQGGEISMKVRAKMDTSTPGVVGGIFFFAFRNGSSGLHDEIDFEFVTSKPDSVMTNSFKNEPLGHGHPQFSPYTSGTITDYHIYEIKWQTDKVLWFVDGNLVRTETDRVPAIPMELHLNIWVTESWWPQAYNPDLQPATSENSNQIFGMTVDWIEIQAKSDLSPVLHLLLKKRL